jgi:hypothetical protein
VPLSALANGYTFDAADDPGIVDPNSPQTLQELPVAQALQNLITFMRESGEQNFAQQLADQAGFIPASYPLNYADYTPPSTLDALLTELGLTGFAESGASTSAASVPDSLAEFATLGML